MKSFFAKLGPGFLFAGAAIGVSHLVQSTRAGADFGFGLLWALLLINAIKYPFFQMGPRYASATGNSLLTGYHQLGKNVLKVYFLLTIATMFTIQTAVTIVTAGIASSLFGFGSLLLWTLIITLLCFGILLIGKYKTLDTLMKIIVLSLTISTIVAVALLLPESVAMNFTQIIPDNPVSIGFLIAFMGWMPAPLDISIWSSMWTVKKKEIDPSITKKQSLFDFNTGYITTTILAIGFLSLGALVMNGSGEEFSSKGGEFANQLISLYTKSLGHGATILIGIAALTTMFSTTLTTLDGSPRALAETSEILKGKRFKRGYLFWLLILIVGTLTIFFFFISEMGLLVKIATILSFLTAPFYAILNYRVITSPKTPLVARLNKGERIYSVICIGVLITFSLWYLSTLL
ncbi:Nramp family divalent metal transporter [Patiriisocius sp. Uisw_017]|jgi:Mn2+/Fe2+ NRAMP family transporter|uniref:Nramp family divalent metal transporter n=1 Tax=Patiriisocius sp. Uisw_017 TaxID=3230968 RepID=UPI0039E85BFF